MLEASFLLASKHVVLKVDCLSFHSTATSYSNLSNSQSSKYDESVHPEINSYFDLTHIIKNKSPTTASQSDPEPL